MNKQTVDEVKDQFFSQVFFAKQKINSLSSNSFVNNTIPQGHGPFFKDSGQNIKYDLMCSKQGNLLGHSHPLSIRSRLDSLNYNSSILSTSSLHEQVQNITSIILKLFGRKYFHQVQFFPNCWELFYAIFKDLGHYESLEQKIICLGEIPQEMSPFQSLGVQDIQSLDNLLNTYESQRLSCLFINLHSKKCPTEILNKPWVSQAIELAKIKALPVIVAELDFFGSYPNFTSLNNNAFSNIDYYVLGNNLPLNISISKKYKKNPPSVPLSVEKVIFTEKMLHLLTEGPFYGEEGRILKIQREIHKHLEPLSPISHGLIFSLPLPKRDVKKIQNSLFDQGIICESSNDNIHLYFPITLLSQHINEICGIIKSTIEDFPCFN